MSPIDLIKEIDKQIDLYFGAATANANMAKLLIASEQFEDAKEYNDKAELFAAKGKLYLNAAKAIIATL